MVKIFKKVILVALIIACSLSCDHSSNSKVDFYQAHPYEADLLRLPLVAPFDLVSISQNGPWCSGIPFSGKLGEFCNIDSLNIHKEFILFHINNGHKHYVIIDTLQHKCLKFDEKLGFFWHLDSLKISSKLYATDEVYRNWNETFTLPWR